MLTFFRRIRKRLLDGGRVPKYLLYAIGEIALVVIGILIALQINNWNERRKDRVREKEILTELKFNIESNIQTLESNSENHERRSSSFIIVNDILENQVPWHDSMAIHFRNAMIAIPVTLSYSAYESLRDFGIGNLQSRELQTRLMTLFENYQDIHSKMTRIVNLELRPTTSAYLMKNFRSSRNDQDLILAIPNDYNRLIKDEKYRNIITYVEQFRQGFFLNLENTGIKEGQEVLRLIEKELERFNKYK